MQANYKQAAERARLPRAAMARYEIRAEADKQIQKRADEYEEKRWEELTAYAHAVDATLLYTLQSELGWGPVRLRRIWEAFIRNRVKARLFFRNGSDYEVQKTGSNIEDTAIRHELKKIGVDIEAWEAEEIHVDEKTGEVTFH